MKDFEATIELMNNYLREMYGQNACFYKVVDNNVGARYETDEISGDWKHTHLYIDALVRDFFGSSKDTKAHLLEVNHFYTESTGSDWGPAVHSLVLTKGEYGDVAQAQIDRSREGMETSVVWHEAQKGIIGWKDAEARVWGEE